MGKYETIQTDIFTIFSTVAWTAENVATYPSNFVASGNTYIRVNIIPSGSGIDLKSVSGILIIDIFIPAGNGPNTIYTIADKLDKYLVGKQRNSQGRNVVQLKNSALGLSGLDPVNPALYRANYTIPFNYFGV